LRKEWTEEEIKLLKDNYYKLNKLELEKLLNRSWASIKHKADRSDLEPKEKVVHFSSSEIQLLKDNYELSQDKLLELFPNRKWASLIYKMEELKLPRYKSWRLWTQEEVNIILNNNSLKDIMLLLPNRTQNQIYNKANELNKYLGNLWTNDEINILKFNYNKLSVKELHMLLLDRTESSIYCRANKLDLDGDISKGLNIQDNDIIYLYLKYQYSCNKIAQILKISLTTVANRLRKCDIKIRSYEFYSGQNSPQWKGGISSERNQIMSSVEYKQWRIDVYERDDYTCQACSDNKGHNLNAHHILNFSDYKDLRLDVNNGITLCENCHVPNIKGSFHNIYGTHNNTKEQLEEYLLLRNQGYIFN